MGGQAFIICLSPPGLIHGLCLATQKQMLLIYSETVMAHTHNTGNYPFDCNLLATGEDELYALYRRGICIQIHQKSKLAFTSQASFLLWMH